MERETLEVDVLIVGAGAAGLPAAYRIKKQIDVHNAAVDQGKASGKKIVDPTILVIEKSSEVGNHIVSGAVMEPRGLRELIPDYKEQGAPIETPVTSSEMRIMFDRKSWALPFHPPGMDNRGNEVISLNKLVRWLGQQVAGLGIDVLTDTPGAEPLIVNGRVVGVRTGDKGADKHGKPKSNFQAGTDIRARLTIFAEGSRGSATKVLVERLGLHGFNPQLYATGIKEVWEVKPEKHVLGKVVHTAGFPLYHSVMGGGFIYHMANRMVSLGLVVSLDYQDPLLDPHLEFQKYKTHPYVRDLLEGGKMLNYGAKTIPEGGFYSLPKSHFPGGLLIGDAGGFLNMQKLKGIHLAIQTGMLAADTAVDALAHDDVSAERLASFTRAFQAAWGHDELFKVRNFRQALQHGFVLGGVLIGFQVLTGGRGLVDRMRLEEGHKHMKTISEYYGTPFVERAYKPPRLDTPENFDKLTDVFHSGATHEEDQVPHLRVADTSICVTRCTEEYGNPCQRFCPANVYEMVPDEKDKEMLKLHLNFSNCVHCKTCDIMDPYGIITWVTPEGGGGPVYQNL